MEILYQIPGSVEAGPLGGAELTRRRKRLQEWAGESTRVEVRDSPAGPHSIESGVEEALCVPAMLKALQQLDAVPDGVIIGCYSDPGLAALREVLDCPVVGPMESSFSLGLQLGDRVGIITVLESVVPLLERLVRKMGLQDRFAGCAAVDIPVLELGSDASRLTRRVRQQAEALVREGRADVVSLGCMSLSFLGVAETLTEELGVPVLNPARTALKTVEQLVSMGLAPSRRAFPVPPKGVLV